MNSGNLAGKTALVTGASRGLGKAIALKLASCGAGVALNYVTNDEEAHKVEYEIREMGVPVMLYKGDVSESDTVRAMIRSITDEWGSIDILVNNAGITRDGLILRMSDDAWDKVIDTNLRGAWLCSKYSLRSMMSREWGRIINIASLAGVIGNAGQANYSAAKGGMIALTKSLAREAGPRNITANAVAPGFIVTDMTDRLPQETRDSILERIPMGRFGAPEDVANLVAFLASEEAGYITAQVIGIDGGVI
ncbi:MAG: 3-oxoacyl-[acyl-carrier-protein] reductase [Dehalococcoidales bacterium]|nr:3-oxoacyl-[acyl-carrier-protein] reductase [Dehalococcoidales bacterium]